MAKRNITLHDKYKSTTALYPKIDASSFTLGAIEKVAEISKDEIEDNVVPNETPTGTPTKLQYITINGVEYYIKEGTLVIANPTLAGTESDLTGIQIGDVKYKISAGGGSGTHLYLHNINMSYDDGLSWYHEKFSFQIINDSDTVIDSHAKLIAYLNTNGFTSTIKYLQVNGVYIYTTNNTLYNLFGIYRKSSSVISAIGTKAGDTNINNDIGIDTPSATFTDTVIDLGVASGGGGGTQVQANWNETDNTSPAYIKNKPNVLTTKELLTTSQSYATCSQSATSISISSPDSGDDELEIKLSVKQGSSVLNPTTISFKTKKNQTGSNPAIYSAYSAYLWSASTLIECYALFNGTTLSIGFYVCISIGSTPHNNIGDFDFKVLSVKELKNY